MENIGTVVVQNLNNEYIPEAKYEVSHVDYGTISVHETLADAVAACKAMLARGEIDAYTVDAE